MTARFAWKALSGAMLWAFMARGALGGGFQVPSQSARAAGQGDAFTAQADDPSAIYYNPAGLTQLGGTQITAGLYAVFPRFGFESALGDQSNNEAAYIPHAYLVSDFGLHDWRFGIGINSVFGLSEDWGSTGPLRTQVTHADLNILNIAPTVSYRVNEHLSLGGALNVCYGTVELNNAVPLSFGPEGKIRIDGHDTELGVTLAALWKPNEHHAFGLVYRSGFRMSFDGSTRIDVPGLPRIGPSDTTESIDLPQIVVAGYTWRPNPRLSLSADVQWADWETLNAVRVKSDDPRFAALPPRRFDFESSFTWRFGAQYQLNDNWAVRAGYVYSQTSSPSSTFAPTVLDLDSHVFTAGVGYARPHWSIDAAYRHIHGVDRDINHSINSPPGRYSDETDAVMVSVTYRF